MPFTLTPINVKDATGTSKPMINYNDGTNNAFAHAVVDSTGAVISPATSGNQTTANSSLATIATNTTGLATAAAQSTGNTSLASIATNTGNVDTAIGAKADSAASTDTGTFSVIAFIKRGLQNWTTLLARTPALGTALAAASTPVVLASDHAALPLPTGAATAANQSTGNTSLATIATNTTGAATAAGVATVATEIGKLYQPRSANATYDGGATMTRPANTTAYAFGDLVGSDASTASNNKVWVIPFCRANDVPGQITGAKLFKSGTGITNTAFRIYLFKNTFTIAQNDNAAFVLPAKADILGILTGSIDEVCADGAYGIFVPKQNVAIPAIPASGTANIFAIIQAVDAYTPVSGEQFSMVLEGFA